jgi:hypothetical protein
MTHQWTEYAVKLRAGVVAAAASEVEAIGYPHGWPMARSVTSTSVDRTGDAVVDIGPWIPLRGAA